MRIVQISAVVMFYHSLESHSVISGSVPAAQVAIPAVLIAPAETPETTSHAKSEGVP